MGTTAVEWRLVQQPSGTVESDLFDITTVEAYNRYASHFIAEIDDPDGTKASDYPRGQRATTEYSTDNGSTWTVKQAGFVQRPDDGDGLGTGLFRCLFIGYDHFLRREPVYDSFSSTTVSSALQTVIENHTPVNYVAGNIDLLNGSASVTREFVGERADEVISWLLAASGDEEYGVNDDFEFFARQTEQTSAPSNILNGDWFSYDLPVEGRHAVNTVRVFYGNGTNTTRSSVIVEDRVSQKDLKDSLGAPRRVVLGSDAHYPEIDNRDAARTKGQEILSRRSPVLTGTVKTFERFDWSPGDTFRLEIPEKGIDDTYAVAEVRHEWSQNETQIKVAQNTDNVGDLLRQLSDDVTRVDLRDADPDATFTRYLDITMGVTVSVSIDVTQTTIADGSFLAGFGSIGDVAGFTLTEDGEPQAGFGATGTSTTTGAGAATVPALNQFRDAWQGESPNTITDFKVGTGTTEPTQTDTDLETAVGGLRTVDAVNASGSYAITFEGTLSAGGDAAGSAISEFGFFESDGTIHNRATLDNPVTHTGTTETAFTVTFTIDTDADREGVITNTGQTRLRDIYVGDVSATTYHADDRAYGTGTTAEAESDSSLGTKLGEEQITHTDTGVGRSSGTIELDTTEANGNDLAEFGDENDNNELLSRVTFEAVGKTSDFNFVPDITFRARPVIL